MRLSLIVLLGSLLLAIKPTSASEIAIKAVPDAAVVGRGVLSYAFWAIYEATLYAPYGRWDPAQPYALSITYFREIKGRDIADTSAQEIRRQGFRDEVTLAAWHTQMMAIFPDVKEGTLLSAVFTPGEHTTFYSGQDIIGTIKGNDFGRYFFGIWLSEQTSDPQLRRALLGQS